MFCQAFNKSLVVEPGKTLAVCCSDSKRMLKATLSDVTSLKDFFYNSEEYKSVRDQVKDLTCPTQFKPCLACHRAVQGYTTEMDVMNKFKFPESKGYDKSVDLKFLEVTTSNICKQSCVMCSAKYSSTHAKLIKKPQFISFMSDDEIKMIYEVLPDIDYICLKGGEPFADQNNLKILTKLHEVNPNIKEIIIISNGQNISNQFKDILSKFDFSQLTLAFSIDGIDEVYEWQRGSKYSDTVNSLNQLYDDTGFTFSVLSTITAYTLPSLLETFQRHQMDFKGIHHYTSTNVVWNPPHTSCALYSQKDLDSIIKPIMEYKIPEIDAMIKPLIDQVKHTCNTWDRSGLDKIKSYGHDNYISTFNRHTDRYNYYRGFDIRKHVPALSLLSND